MLINEKRYSVLFRAISVGMLCLFLINSVIFADIEHNTLSPKLLFSDPRNNAEIQAAVICELIEKRAKQWKGKTIEQIYADDILLWKKSTEPIFEGCEFRLELDGIRIYMPNSNICIRYYNSAPLVEQKYGKDGMAKVPESYKVQQAFDLQSSQILHAQKLIPMDTQDIPPMEQISEKAHKLLKMKRIGLNVPRFFIIATDGSGQITITDKLREMFDSIPKPVIVRSAHRAEGVKYPFSGVFDSFGGITVIEPTKAEIIYLESEEFWDEEPKLESLVSAYRLILEGATEGYRAKKYFKEHNITDFDPKQMNAVVMEEIDLDIFGMFMTSSQNNPDEVLIHYQVIDRAAEEEKADLERGSFGQHEEKGGVITYNRKTRQLDQNDLDEQTRDVLIQFGDIAGQIEDMFGVQQIELGAADGKIYVLQSRNINLSDPRDVPRLAHYETMDESLHAIGYGYYYLPILVIDSLGKAYPGYRRSTEYKTLEDAYLASGKRWEGAEWDALEQYEEDKKNEYREELRRFQRKHPEYVLVIKDASAVLDSEMLMGRNYGFINELASQAKVVIRGRNQNAIRHEDWQNVELGALTIIPPEATGWRGFIHDFVCSRENDEHDLWEAFTSPSKKRDNVSVQRVEKLQTGDAINILSNTDGVFVWVGNPLMGNRLVPTKGKPTPELIKVYCAKADERFLQSANRMIGNDRHNVELVGGYPLEELRTILEARETIELYPLRNLEVDPDSSLYEEKPFVESNESTRQEIIDETIEGLKEGFIAYCPGDERFYIVIDNNMGFQYESWTRWEIYDTEGKETVALIPRSMLVDLEEQGKISLRNTVYCFNGSREELYTLLGIIPDEAGSESTSGKNVITDLNVHKTLILGTDWQKTETHVVNNHINRQIIYTVKALPAPGTATKEPSVGAADGFQVIKMKKELGDDEIMEIAEKYRGGETTSAELLGQQLVPGITPSGLYDAFPGLYDNMKLLLRKSIFGTEKSGSVSFKENLEGAEILVIGQADNIINLLNEYPKLKAIHLVDVDKETLRHIDGILAQLKEEKQPLPEIYGYCINALELPDELEGKIDVVAQAGVFDRNWFTKSQLKQAAGQIEKVLKPGGIYRTPRSHELSTFWTYFGESMEQIENFLKVTLLLKSPTPEPTLNSDSIGIRTSPASRKLLQTWQLPVVADRLTADNLTNQTYIEELRQMLGKMNWPVINLDRIEQSPMKKAIVNEMISGATDYSPYRHLDVTLPSQEVIMNAVMHGYDAKVDLHIRRYEDDSEKLEIEVTNKGEGIENPNTLLQKSLDFLSKRYGLRSMDDSAPKNYTGGAGFGAMVLFPDEVIIESNGKKWVRVGSDDKNTKFEYAGESDVKREMGVRITLGWNRELHTRTADGQKDTAATTGNLRSTQDMLNEFTQANGDLISLPLTDPRKPVLLRYSVEELELAGMDNSKKLLQSLQGANSYIELYYSTGKSEEVSQEVYRAFDLDKSRIKEFNERVGGNRTKENTITLFPVLKGEIKTNTDIQRILKDRLGCLSHTETQVIPIGLQNDQGGLIRGTVLGLIAVDIARNKTGNGGKVDPVFMKDYIEPAIKRYNTLCKSLGGADINLTANDITLLATVQERGFNGLLEVLHKLINLLPIIPIDPDELRQIYEYTAKQFA